MLHRLLYRLIEWCDRVSHSVRRRNILSRCAVPGRQVRLRMPLVVYHPENLRFGEQVDVGENVVLRASGGLSIGSRVLIAAGAVLTTVGHPLQLPRWGRNVSAPIVIGDDVWIGANAVILPGVTIGDGSVIAAGAVVTADVPPLSVAAGVPARVIRRIDSDPADINETATHQVALSVENGDA